MLKRMGGMLAAACVAVALTGCAGALSVASEAATLASSFTGGGFGQLQFLPAAPESITVPAQQALNKAKVAITVAADGVYAGGDGLKLAASLGLLKGPAAHTARQIYDEGVAGVNAAVSAANAAQAAINAGKTPNLSSIADAIAKINDAGTKVKALAQGSGG